MNVKPGDMARVFALGDPCHNTIVEVICATPADEYPPGYSSEFMWDVKIFNGAPTTKWRGGIPFDGYALPGAICTAHDRYLRRIDPKADDIVDEEAERIAAPREAVSA